VVDALGEEARRGERVAAVAVAHEQVPNDARLAAMLPPGVWNELGTEMPSPLSST
jgi:hypothetical protein